MPLQLIKMPQLTLSWNVKMMGMQALGMLGLLEILMTGNWS